MPVPTPTIIGYYRFTDIFFEWYQALPNPEDVGPLKALIAYDALVHPDHPLRKQGMDGIELHVGTFDNGEARLLFSSAQVEYMRYWIHAMSLTKELIPLPSSEYLITQGSMQSCSPAIYKNAAEMKKAVRQIDKNNKRLKGTEPLLTSRRLGFERIRMFWGDKVGTWIAVDFETWDRDHTVFTEFGWCLIRWENDKEIEENGHLVVKEHRKFWNTYVPNHRDNYLFGQSEDIDKKTFKHKVGELIAQYRADGPVFLVFHDASQDVKYLRSSQIDAPLVNLCFLLPETTPKDGLYAVDTAELFAGLEGESSSNTRGLEQTCRHLGISCEYMHNAGNDAHYTMHAIKSMASGDPIDVQREKRWPEYISSNRPKVEFRPSDDSDLSDTEGLISQGYKLSKTADSDED